MRQIKFPFPFTVEIIKQRSTKYYTNKTKLPKKYIKQGAVLQNNVWKLNGEKIIKNAKTAGLPERRGTSGNIIYGSATNTSVYKNIKVIEILKNMFSPIVRQNFFIIKKFPIKIHFCFSCKEMPFDISNSWLICKIIEDLFKNYSVIPDDNSMYVNEIKTSFKKTDTAVPFILVTIYENGDSP